MFKLHIRYNFFYNNHGEMNQTDFYQLNEEDD